MKTNQEYKNDALSALSGNWVPAVLAAIVYYAVMAVLLGCEYSPKFIHALANKGWIGSGSYYLLAIFIATPLGVGYTNAIRALFNYRDINVTRNMLNMGFNPYLKIVWTLFLKDLKVVLWSLLLIVPGILKAFSYAMTPYIVKDYPELTASQAIAKSTELMEGHRFDLFYLYLSFLGWFILAMCTAGIGLFWLQPYMEAAVAGFYNDLKAEKEPIIITE